MFVTFLHYSIIGEVKAKMNVQMNAQRESE